MLINIDQYWSILNNINRPHPPAARRDLYIYHRSILINIDQFEQYWPPSPAGGEICIFTIADQYWSILTALTRRRRDMYIDQRSILINIDQYWSILINIEQYWPASPVSGEICILTIDQYWSILINIDQYWTILTSLIRRRRDLYIDHRSILIYNDQYWSILINIEQYWPARFLYQYWSILINFDRHHPPGGEICILTIDQCWSILINIDQYWTILTALTRQRPGEICIFTIDQYWSILINLNNIDRPHPPAARFVYLQSRINIDQYWPPSLAGAEICILTIDQYWSILINIDQYWSILNNIDRPHPSAATFVY